MRYSKEDKYEDESEKALEMQRCSLALTRKGKVDLGCKSEYQL